MQESVMQRMWNSGYLSGGNAAYVEELYELYLHDPNAVPEEWRTYFQKLPADGGSATDVSHSTIRDHFVLLAKNQRRAQPVSAGSVSSEHEKKQVEVLRLIQAYRVQGPTINASRHSWPCWRAMMGFVCPDSDALQFGHKRCAQGSL